MQNLQLPRVCSRLALSLGLGVSLSFGVLAQPFVQALNGLVRSVCPVASRSARRFSSKAAILIASARCSGVALAKSSRSF